MDKIMDLIDKEVKAAFIYVQNLKENMLNN